MPRYVAFLRGINVGGHRVQMSRLRDEFAALGFTAAETFIASGNVIFDSPSRSTAALESRIEAHLGAALGYAVPTLLRTPAELRDVLAHLPFTPDEVSSAHAVHVIFLREPIGADEDRAVRALDTPVDLLRSRGRELYWWCRGLLSESQVPPAAFGRVLGRRVTTMRNTTMLKKLVAKL